jgi:hypothetical protein
MARRSILSSVREEKPAPAEPGQVAPETAPESVPKRAGAVAPSRRAKLHIGGYYDPDEPTIVAFQKLGIDLRETQQQMLLEALRDFVAKHQAASAFLELSH